MLDKILTPTEKKRLDRSMSLVVKLSRTSKFSEINAYIVRERMREVLTILGGEHPTRIMIADSIEIIKDIWPFKLFRLRKLINGRPQ